MIVEPVLDLLAVHVDGIVVILGVHDEAAPFPPAGRNVRAVIFVQVFAEVTCNKNADNHRPCLGLFATAIWR